ncbi:hypothetical protein ZE01_003264 [Salmonella enterica subsp. diarizonae]|nr:hypothetical protein [Salmonella enterica subsp. diarizonae]
MTTMNINRKQSQGNHWQDTLQDYKARMTKQQQTQQGAPESDKTTSAYKVKPDSGKTPQNAIQEATGLYMVSRPLQAHPVPPCVFSHSTNSVVKFRCCIRARSDTSTN